MRTERVRVRRLTLGQARYWLGRRSLDGARLRRGELVCVCAGCRGIVRFRHWREGGVCPSCGCADSLPDLKWKRRAAAGDLPAAFSSRCPTGAQTALAVLVCSALCVLLLTALISEWTRSPWRVDADGYMRCHAGAEQSERGVLSVSGSTFDLRAGVVRPPRTGLYRLGGTVWYIEADGFVPEGFFLAEGELLFSSREGVRDARRAMDFRGAGFYTLEGMGLRFVDDDLMLPTGIIAHEGHLHRLSEGAPVPGDAASDVLEGGSFDALGRLVPVREGLVRCSSGVYYLAEDGALQSGFQFEAGSVYYFDPIHHRVSLPPHIPGTLAPGGAFMPKADTRLELDGVSYLLRAGESRLHTGWIVQNDALCWYDALGAQRTEAYCAAPRGRFDEEGRLIPALAGACETDDGRVYCLNLSGAVQTGYWFLDGALYLFDGSSGLRAANRRLTDACYAGADGRIRGDGLTRLGGARYCLTPEGDALTGWRLLNGRLYYFSPEDARLFSGRVIEQGVEYNLHALEGYLSPPCEGVYELDGQAYRVTALGEASYADAESNPTNGGETR